MTLMQGEFRKGGKVADKNVEVTLTVCNGEGEVIEVSRLRSDDIAIVLSCFSPIFILDCYH